MITKKALALALALTVAHSDSAHTDDLVTTVSRTDRLKMDFLPAYDGRYVYVSRYDISGNAKSLLSMTWKRTQRFPRSGICGSLHWPSRGTDYLFLPTLRGMQKCLNCVR